LTAASALAPVLAPVPTQTLGPRTPRSRPLAGRPSSDNSKKRAARCAILKETL